MGKKVRFLLISALSFLMISGCIFRPVDDLYRLPERFPGYESLETEIAKVREELSVLGTSVEYANIVSGENTATIQIRDMDGDGVRESAVTFFRVMGSKDEKAIKIYVFKQDNEGKYRINGIVEGEGSAIYAVDFQDINGNGQKELIVSWQSSRGVNTLGVYTLDDHTLLKNQTEGSDAGPTWKNPKYLGTELLAPIGYSGYTFSDFTQNGLIELAVARIDTASGNNTVTFYTWGDGALISHQSIPISSGILSLREMQVGYLDEMVPAAFLTSVLSDNGIAIDIVMMRDGNPVNLNLDMETMLSRDVLWDYVSPEPTDIDGDRVLEIPQPVELPVYDPENTAKSWIVQWKKYNQNGKSEIVFSTYQNTQDGWFFVVPDEWIDKVCIYRSDAIIGQRSVIFARYNGEDVPSDDFLAIFTLTGPNRHIRAQYSDRFKLADDTTTVYAATFYPAYQSGLSEMDVLDRFHRIIAEWTG